MLQILNEYPAYVVAVRAIGEVTKEDYESVMTPAIEKASKEYEEISFLMIMDTDFSNFTFSAWMNDAWLSLKNYLNWSKIAVVTDEKGLEKVTDLLRFVIPGKAKGFSHNELEQAKAWISSPALQRKEAATKD